MMALFGFGRKKEKAGKKPTCSCENLGTERLDTTRREKENGEIRCVKVLGTGCKYCHALLQNTQAAVKSMELPIEPEYVTDLEKVMAYGVMTMPALVVNEKVVSAGKVLKEAEIKELLHLEGTH